MRNLVFLGLALVFLFSCKKETEELQENNNQVPVSYMPLKIGNYWIYQTYKIDSLGNESIDGAVDSVRVTKDTLINGNTYFVLEGEFVSIPSLATQPIACLPKANITTCQVPAFNPTILQSSSSVTSSEISEQKAQISPQN